MEILISIEHKYAESIYKRTKRYELGKVTPKIPEGTKCYIYEPLPKGKVTGYFIYAGEIVMDKFLFWQFNNDKLGVTYDEYLEFYEGHEKVHAWMITFPTKLYYPYTLKEIGQYPPKSYTIISK